MVVGNLVLPEVIEITPLNKLNYQKARLLGLHESALAFISRTGLIEF